MSNKIELSIGDKGVWEGIVERVIYLGQNNYSIIGFKINNGPSVTAEGNIPAPEKGTTVKIKGTVVDNPKYGIQIHAESTVNTTSSEMMAAIQFLSSKAINGIGPKLGTEIVKKFGTNLEDILLDKKKLVQISSINSAKADKIINSYKKNRGLYQLFQLTNGKITYHQSKKIFEKYGNSSYEKVKNNPYQLIYDIDGIGFVSADNLALKIGFKFDSEERIYAALVYCLKDAAMVKGHCYLPEKELREQVSDLIFSLNNLKNVYYQDTLGLSGVPDNCEDWDELSLPTMIKEHKKKLENILKDWDNDTLRNKVCKNSGLTQDEIDTLDYFYSKKVALTNILDNIIKENCFDITGKDIKDAYEELFLSKNINKRLILEKGRLGESSIMEREMFLMECNVAETLVDLVKQPPIRNVTDEIIEQCISDVQNNGITLDPDQIEAVATAIKNRISIISGGPGRGKTTIIKIIITAWKLSVSAKGKRDAKIVLLAPTGKAAKRMSEATGEKAMTVHRFLLSARSKGNTEAVDNDDTFVFVDETSMVDLYLAKWLLNNIKRAQICFVGDVDQLESVGPGFFLGDMIESKVIPCSYLKHCHRNAGSIYGNTTVINEGGRIQELQTDNHFKTLWIPANQEASVIVDTAVNLYKANLEKYGAANMMVLTPMRDKITGVNNLNARLQEIANPPEEGKEEYKTFSGGKQITLRVGDRVMQTVNNYKREVVLSDGEHALGVFNGETGIINSIDKTNDIIEVVFDDGKIGFYPCNEADELTLSYALTYHKSQGSEYPFVICMLCTADFIMLRKRMLYTGVSRAQNLEVCLGHAKAFQMAIDNSNGDSKVRNTMLKQRIIEYNTTD